MLKKRFIKNSLLLTATLFITRAIAVIFNIYISSKIGAEGVGIYRLTSTVYFFSTTFATSGITLAVTRLITDALAKKKYGNAKWTVSFCITISIILSSAVGALLFVFSKPVGISFLGDARTVLSLKVLSFSLPFMAISACLRGYFLARRTVIKTTSEQLFEQIIEIIVCVSIITPFSAKGLSYACCAVATGTTLSEIASCIYSLILYKLDIAKYKVKREKAAGVVKSLISIGLPVTGSSCLRSGLSMIENTLIPSGLQKYGLSSTKSLEDYGVITGMALPVLMFPSVFLSAFSTLMIPEMSEANAENRVNSISHMARKVLKLTFLFIIPVTALFLTFSDKIGILLYGREDVGLYIKILAMTVPFTYLDSVVDGMLKGLNQQLHYFTYNIIDSTVRVLLALFLIPKMGIKAVIIIMFVSAILNSTLSTYRLLKVAKIEIDFINWILKPVAVSAFFAIILSALF